MSEERALIERAVRGEPGAIDALAALHRSSILRTARHLLDDDAAAEDVAQDALVRLQASLPGFRGESELSTWLYRVTLNLCRDRRRNARRRTGEVELSMAAGAPEMRVDPSPEHHLDVQRARAAVREAIDRLPQAQREALLLRFVEDLRYTEIARITGTPEGTVASRVFRALERLGRDLEPKHLEVVK